MEPVKLPNPIAARLSELSTLAEKKGQEYGDSYLLVGDALKALLPDGIRLQTVTEYRRFGVLVQIFSKLQRYCHNFEAGHPDSLDDLSVYAQILRELDGHDNIPF